jgi:hypothetical protein
MYILNPPEFTNHLMTENLFPQGLTGKTCAKKATQTRRKAESADKYW